VKYKQIENDLLEKIKTHPNENIGYNEADVENICDELYKYELFQVFTSLMPEKPDEFNIENPIFCKTMEYLWERMKCLRVFFSIVEKYKKKYYPETNIEDDVVFVSMFNYHVFHRLHPCICDFLLNGNIQLANLEELDKITIPE
jgi:hypothetical protein